MIDAQKPSGWGRQRDALWVDPTLTKDAESETRRLAKQFGLDVVDAKELYRTIMRVAVDFAADQKPAR